MWNRKLKAPCYLDPSLVKQIAGRAGRKSSAYEFGEVTAWQVIEGRHNARA
jgi:hypothetical protein